MSAQDAATAIRVRLAELRWSQAVLAEDSGVSSETIGRLLAGAQAPHHRTRSRLEQALGWSPGTIGALIAGAPPPPPDRSQLDGHLAAVFRLHGVSTPRERAQLLFALALEQALPEDPGSG